MDSFPVSRTLQEWFDIAWQRAKDPRRCSRDCDTHGSDRCSYEAIGDIPPCFIGSGLTREQQGFAEANNSGSMASDLMEAGLIYVEGPKHDGDDLDRLQAIHDCGEPEGWRYQLIDYANERGLTIPVT